MPKLKLISCPKLLLIVLMVINFWFFVLNFKIDIDFSAIRSMSDLHKNETPSLDGTNFIGRQ